MGAAPKNAGRNAGAKRQPCAEETFEGEVKAGESFRRALGGGVDFVLEAGRSGWVVRVVPSASPRPAVDWAELATPPFRSVNPLLLTTDFGFRAQDIVGWNPRRFRYVSSSREASLAERAYRAVLASPRPTTGAEAEVARISAQAREGTLTILDARLMPGMNDQGPAANLVATHFATTAHTIESPRSGVDGRLGRVNWMRFRVTPPTRSDAACNGPKR